MNEKAFEDLYQEFVRTGYEGSKDDFSQLISTNPKAFDDGYGLFKDTGYTGTEDQFAELIGVKKPSLKKKDQNSISDSTEGEETITSTTTTDPQNGPSDYSGKISSERYQELESLFPDKTWDYGQSRVSYDEFSDFFEMDKAPSDTPMPTATLGEKVEHKVEPRIGTRKNDDGTESTHLMMREYIPEEGGWVAFPSLFQDKHKWFDYSQEDGYGKAYEEAKRRGEIYKFGEDEEEAIEFADKGSWKQELDKSNLEKTMSKGVELAKKTQAVKSYVQELGLMGVYSEEDFEEVSSSVAEYTGVDKDLDQILKRVGVEQSNKEPQRAYATRSEDGAEFITTDGVSKIADLPEGISAVDFNKESHKVIREMEQFEYDLLGKMSSEYGVEEIKNNQDVYVKRYNDFISKYFPGEVEANDIVDVIQASYSNYVMRDSKDRLESLKRSSRYSGRDAVIDNRAGQAIWDFSLNFAESGLGLTRMIGDLAGIDVISASTSEVSKEMAGMRQGLRERELSDAGIKYDDVQKTVTELMVEGKRDAAMAKFYIDVSDTAVDLAYQIVATAAGGGKNFVPILFGFRSAGQKYYEIADDPSMSIAQKTMYAGLMGGVEFASEKMFGATEKLAGSFIRKSFGEAIADEVSKKTSKSILKKTLKFTEEGQEEVVVTMSDQLLGYSIEWYNTKDEIDAKQSKYDNMLDGDPKKQELMSEIVSMEYALEEKKIFDWYTVSDSFILGVALGTSTQVLTYSAKYGLGAIGSSISIKDQIQIKEKYKEIMDQLGKEKDPGKRAELKRQAGKLVDASIRLKERDGLVYEQMNDQELAEIIGISKRINVARQMAQKLKMARINPDAVKKWGGVEKIDSKIAELTSEVQGLLDSKQKIEGKYVQIAQAQLDERGLDEDSVRIIDEMSDVDNRLSEFGELTSGEVMIELTPENAAQKIQEIINSGNVKTTSYSTAESIIQGLKNTLDIIKSSFDNNTKVFVHGTKDSFLGATNQESVSRGLYVSSGEIHLYAPALKSNTAYHEAMHPEVMKRLGTKGITEFAKVMAGAIMDKDMSNGMKQFLSRYMGDQAVKSISEAVSESDEVAEEFLVELASMMEEGSISATFKKGLATKLKEFVSKMFGGDIAEPRMKDVLKAINNVINREDPGIDMDQGSVKIDKKAIIKNTMAEVERLKALGEEAEDGATLNIDGTEYDGGGLVVPAGSINTSQEDITPEAIADFFESNKGKIGADNVKVGLYKFPGSNKISIDLNVVAPREFRAVALEFGRMAGQDSLYDLDSGEYVNTGADGSNPSEFTDAEFKAISEALSRGEMPRVEFRVGSESETTKQQKIDGDPEFKLNSSDASSVALFADPSIINPKRRKNGRVKVLDLGEALDQRAKEKGYYIDLDSRDTYTEEEIDKMSDAMADDAELQLKQDDSGIGWYDTKTRSALDLMSRLHPEISDPNSEENLRFTLLVALISQNNTVSINFREANDAYTYYKENGKLPNRKYSGKSGSIIKKNIGKSFKKIDEKGFSEFKELLQTEKTVKEWKDDGYVVGGELVSENLTGAMVILGSKIGSFWGNLNGDFSTLTADLWFSRMFNRYTGNVVAKKDIQKNKEAVISELKKHRGERLLHGFDKKEIIANNEIFNQWLEKTVENYKKGNYQDKRTINVVANTLYNNMGGGLQDIPRNGSERRAMREAIRATQNKLVERGYPRLDIADIQAILWYNEKDLYGLYGAVNKSSEKTDYETAAQEVLKSKGVNSEVSPEFRRDESLQLKGSERGADATGNRSGKQKPGSSTTAKAQLINNTPVSRRLFNEPNPETKVIADRYKAKSGIQIPDGVPITSVDEERAKRIADAYESMKDSPNNPEVQKAYKKLAEETLSQYEVIVEAGYEVELWDGYNEPYANSFEMISDLGDNKHLYIFSTEEGFGESEITDKQREQNALLQDSNMKDKNGKTLLYNDVFRFVHDFFGHSERGNSFGPIGEENAWDVHSRMYSPIARRAMTTETRGQNSWVNFGPQVRNAKGELIRKGEKGYLPLKDRAFADQKMGLLPSEFSEILPSVKNQLIAPNGNPSNLNQEQHALVRTEQFKEWFGDWENDPENASKVVDENGEPLVVYHGSISEDIEVFDRGQSKRPSSGLKEYGSYFASNPNLSEMYAGDNGNVYPVFLNLRDMKSFDANGELNIEAWNNLEANIGYKWVQGRTAMEAFSGNNSYIGDKIKVDGIKAENIIDMSLGIMASPSVYKEMSEYKDAKDKYLGDVYLVFDGQPQNIKLADGSNQTFDPVDPSIKAQKFTEEYNYADKGGNPTVKYKAQDDLVKLISQMIDNTIDHMAIEKDDFGDYNIVTRGMYLFDKYHKDEVMNFLTESGLSKVKAQEIYSKARSYKEGRREGRKQADREARETLGKELRKLKSESKKLRKDLQGLKAKSESLDQFLKDAIAMVNDRMQKRGNPPFSRGQIATLFKIVRQAHRVSANRLIKDGHDAVMNDFIDKMSKIFDKQDAKQEMQDYIDLLNTIKNLKKSIGNKMKTKSQGQALKSRASYNEVWSVLDSIDASILEMSSAVEYLAALNALSESLKNMRVVDGEVVLPKASEYRERVPSGGLLAFANKLKEDETMALNQKLIADAESLAEAEGISFEDAIDRIREEKRRKVLSASIRSMEDYVAKWNSNNPNNLLDLSNPMHFNDVAEALAQERVNKTEESKDVALNDRIMPMIERYLDDLLSNSYIRDMFGVSNPGDFNSQELQNRLSNLSQRELYQLEYKLDDFLMNDSVFGLQYFSAMVKAKTIDIPNIQKEFVDKGKTSSRSRKIWLGLLDTADSYFRLIFPGLTRVELAKLRKAIGMTSILSNTAKADAIHAASVEAMSDKIKKIENEGGQIRGINHGFLMQIYSMARQMPVDEGVDISVSQSAWMNSLRDISRRTIDHLKNQNIYSDKELAELEDAFESIFSNSQLSLQGMMDQIEVEHPHLVEFVDFMVEMHQESMPFFDEYVMSFLGRELKVEGKYTPFEVKQKKDPVSGEVTLEQRIQDAMKTASFNTVKKKAGSSYERNPRSINGKNNILGLDFIEINEKRMRENNLLANVAGDLLRAKFIMASDTMEQMIPNDYTRNNLEQKIVRVVQEHKASTPLVFRETIMVGGSKYTNPVKHLQKAVIVKAFGSLVFQTLKQSTVGFNTMMNAKNMMGATMEMISGIAEMSYYSLKTGFMKDSKLALSSEKYSLLKRSPVFMRDYETSIINPYQGSVRLKESALSSLTDKGMKLSMKNLTGTDKIVAVSSWFAFYGDYLVHEGLYDSFSSIDWNKEALSPNMTALGYADMLVSKDQAPSSPREASDFYSKSNDESWNIIKGIARNIIIPFSRFALNSKRSQSYSWLKLSQAKSSEARGEALLELTGKLGEAAGFAYASYTMIPLAVGYAFSLLGGGEDDEEVEVTQAERKRAKAFQASVLKEFNPVPMNLVSPIETGYIMGINRMIFFATEDMERWRLEEDDSMETMYQRWSESNQDLPVYGGYEDARWGVDLIRGVGGVYGQYIADNITTVQNIGTGNKYVSPSGREYYIRDEDKDVMQMMTALQGAMGVGQFFGLSSKEMESIVKMMDDLPRSRSFDSEEELLGFIMDKDEIVKRAEAIKGIHASKIIEKKVAAFKKGAVSKVAEEELVNIFGKKVYDEHSQEMRRLAKGRVSSLSYARYVEDRIEDMKSNGMSQEYINDYQNFANYYMAIFAKSKLEMTILLSQEDEFEN